MSRKSSALPRSIPDEASVTQSPAELWKQLFGCPAPSRMPALIAQAVSWQQQMLIDGDVSPAIARDLTVIVADIEARRAPLSGGLEATIEAVTAESNPVAKGASRDDVVAGPVSRRRPRGVPARSSPQALPPASSQLLVGTRLVKTHGGMTHVVEVTAEGMSYDGQLFSSLSSVAKHITGTHWNGLLFFGLRRRKAYPPKAAASG